MNVIQVQAEERFDTKELSNEIVDGCSGNLYTAYTCPSCKQKISFSRKDFENRGRRETSNLLPEHRAIISALVETMPFCNEQYLDWYCPKCKLPARAYFSQWAGGRHGDSGVSIVAVVEIPSEVSNAL